MFPPNKAAAKGDNEAAYCVSSSLCAGMVGAHIRKEKEEVVRDLGGISRLMGCSLGLLSLCAPHRMKMWPGPYNAKQICCTLPSSEVRGETGSCFLLPDLSGRIESHLLPISPSSQGDTVGKASSCWPECVSVCSQCACGGRAHICVYVPASADG